MKNKLICFIDFIKRWFSYFKILKTSYDFDYGSILDVEKHQITRVRNYIKKYKRYVGWEKDVEKMNLAIKLLTLIEQDNVTTIKYLEDGSYIWKCTKYVNIKNVSRFNKSYNKYLTGDYEDSFKEIIKGDLYIEKAWNLYFKLRMLYTRNWWD